MKTIHRKCVLMLVNPIVVEIKVLLHVRDAVGMLDIQSTYGMRLAN